MVPQAAGSVWQNPGMQVRKAKDAQWAAPRHGTSVTVYLQAGYTLGNGRGTLWL